MAKITHRYLRSESFHQCVVQCGDRTGHSWVVILLISIPPKKPTTTNYIDLTFKESPCQP